MQRPPRGADAELLPRRALLKLAAFGLVMAVCSLGVMEWAQGTLGEPTARSMGLVTFALAGIFLALECNDDPGSVFSIATLQNGKLVQMSLFSLVATILLTELGLFQRIFDTVSLSVNQWTICLVLASVIAWVMEVEKLVRRRRTAPPADTQSAIVAAPVTAPA